jgi:hypothetical protein
VIAEDRLLIRLQGFRRRLDAVEFFAGRVDGLDGDGISLKLFFGLRFGCFYASFKVAYKKGRLALAAGAR